MSKLATRLAFLVLAGAVLTALVGQDWGPAFFRHATLRGGADASSP